MDKKISTHLWYDKEAKEAAEFYASVFPDSKIKSVNTLSNTPSGNVEIVSAEICGQPFTLLSAGPLFKFNPSISFFVACDTKEEIDAIWEKLILGGKALMDLGEYPFSPRYGWVADKYGLSWQIMFMNGQKATQKLIPALTFVGKIYGKLEEAINFYTSVFHNSKINYTMRYEKGEEPDNEGNIKHAGFILETQQFSAMESAREHNFAFNEAISFMVSCENQEEIDYYWEKLSAVPEAEQCGWLKDKYGLSWQIVPTAMNELMGSGDKEKMDRVTQAFLKMKKFDLAKLQAAAAGE